MITVNVLVAILVFLDEALAVRGYGDSRHELFADVVRKGQRHKMHEPQQQRSLANHQNLGT